jgi:hypothetical protein
MISIRQKINIAKGYAKQTYQKLRYSSKSYFQAADKVYLASADQFKGMEKLVESQEILQCEHFYSVIGGLGGLNILSRLNAPKTIHFFDINPHTINICHLIIKVILISDKRDDFITNMYGRVFDSNKYSFANQEEYYSLPVEADLLETLRQKVGEEDYKTYEKFYLPYIEDPMKDVYDGESIHCTRMPIFHEARANEVMTHPFIGRSELKAKGITSINSFFFGKGWLKNEERFIQVKKNLIDSKVVVSAASIFNLNPPRNSGLYASNVLDGDEKQFEELIKNFTWTLWYSRRSRYLQLEYMLHEERLLPFQQVYGKGIKDTHRSCCQLLDEQFDLNKQDFLEIIEPHITEGINYGFRFYSGQQTISVSEFIEKYFDDSSLPEIIGIHILMGGGCPIDTWKQVVTKALSYKRDVFIFEHRKECRDWPEWDVNPDDILPEKDIDKFLLSLTGSWRKFGTANKKGNSKDIRNICWILRHE